MSLLDDLAATVRSALHDEGLTPDQLASQAQLPRAKIDDVLAAKPSLTSRELTRIAEALHLDPHALQRGRHEPSRSPAVFLKHSSAFQDFHPSDGETVSWVLDRGIALAALHPEGNQFRRSFEPAVIPVPGSAAAHGYRLASELRSRLKIQGAVPDVRTLLEQVLAIPVYARDLTTRATAMAICAPRKAAAAIMINAHRAPPLSSPGGRMILAHELCHILFDPADSGVQIVVENDSTNRFEQRANAFAAEFLCPLLELQAMFPHGITSSKVLRDAEKVAAHFRINLVPALRQLQNRLGVPAEHIEPLVEKTSPPDGLSRQEDSPELLRLAREAWHSDRSSSAQAKAFLGLSASDELPWPEA